MEDINIGFYYKFVTCRVGDISSEEFEFFINWFKNPDKSNIFNGLDWSKLKLGYFDLLKTEEFTDKQSLTFQAFMDCYTESYKFDKDFMDYIFREKNINDLLGDK